MENKSEKTILWTLLIIIITIIIFIIIHFFSEENIDNELLSKVEKFQKQHTELLGRLNKSDSTILEIQKELVTLKTKKDSLSKSLHSDVKTVKKLTEIKINNDDIKEALLWIDSTNHSR